MINIDRNPLSPLMGDVAIIDPSFSSVSEIVAQVILEMGYMMDPDAAQNLLDGVLFATQNFTSPTTSAYAFESAGFLLQNGAKRKEQVARPQNNRDLSDVRADLERNFPREDHFLNQRPPRNRQQLQQPGQGRQGQGGGTPPRNPQPQGGFQGQRNQRGRNFPNQNRGGGQQQPQPRQNQPKFQQPTSGFDAFNDLIDDNPRLSTPVQDEIGLNMPDPILQTMPVEPKTDQTSDNFAAPTHQMTKASGEAETAINDEIPEDWFLPKVFKGSKRGN